MFVVLDAFIADVALQAAGSAVALQIVGSKQPAALIPINDLLKLEDQVKLKLHRNETPLQLEVMRGKSLAISIAASQRLELHLSLLAGSATDAEMRYIAGGTLILDDLVRSISIPGATEPAVLQTELSLRSVLNGGELAALSLLLRLSPPLPAYLEPWLQQQEALQALAMKDNMSATGGSGGFASLPSAVAAAAPVPPTLVHPATATHTAGSAADENVDPMAAMLRAEAKAVQRGARELQSPGTYSPGPLLFGPPQVLQLAVAAPPSTASPNAVIASPNAVISATEQFAAAGLADTLRASRVAGNTGAAAALHALHAASLAAASSSMPLPSAPTPTTTTTNAFGESAASTATFASTAASSYALRQALAAANAESAATAELLQSVAAARLQQYAPPQSPGYGHTAQQQQQQRDNLRMSHLQPTAPASAASSAAPVDTVAAAAAAAAAADTSVSSSRSGLSPSLSRARIGGVHASESPYAELLAASKGGKGSKGTTVSPAGSRRASAVRPATAHAAPAAQAASSPGAAARPATATASASKSAGKRLAVAPPPNADGSPVTGVRLTSSMRVRLAALQEEKRMDRAAAAAAAAARSSSHGHGHNHSLSASHAASERGHHNLGASFRSTGSAGGSSAGGSTPPRAYDSASRPASAAAAASTSTSMVASPRAHLSFSSALSAPTQQPQPQARVQEQRETPQKQQRREEEEEEEEEAEEELPNTSAYVGTPPEPVPRPVSVTAAAAVVVETTLAVDTSQSQVSSVSGGGVSAHSANISAVSVSASASASRNASVLQLTAVDVTPEPIYGGAAAGAAAVVSTPAAVTGGRAASGAGAAAAAAAATPTTPSGTAALYVSALTNTLMGISSSTSGVLSSPCATSTSGPGASGAASAAAVAAAAATGGEGDGAVRTPTRLLSALSSPVSKELLLFSPPSLGTPLDEAIAEASDEGSGSSSSGSGGGGGGGHSAQKGQPPSSAGGSTSGTVRGSLNFNLTASSNSMRAAPPVITADDLEEESGESWEKSYGAAAGEGEGESAAEGSAEGGSAEDLF